MDFLSAAAARRVALAAQGFGRPLPDAVGTRQLNLALQRLQVLQLDSVNVLERSHYLPMFARLGAYDKALLDRLTFAKKAPYREYWAHEAALIPLEDWPLFGFRRHDFRRYYAAANDPWLAAHADTLAWLRAELADKGPLPASKIERDAVAPRRGSWWDWDEVKRGLERMFRFGEVVSAVLESGGALFITADHGNADHMLEDDGSPNTAHSLNPVPVIVTVDGVRLRDGGVLADVAPTLLQMLGVEQPAEMTGRSLIAG